MSLTADPCQPDSCARAALERSLRTSPVHLLPHNMYTAWQSTPLFSTRVPPNSPVLGPSKGVKPRVPRQARCAAGPAPVNDTRQAECASGPVRQGSQDEAADLELGQKQAATPQQAVGGGLLNSFGSSLNPLWDLVVGWKRQNGAPESASSSELLARTAARASQVPACCLSTAASSCPTLGKLYLDAFMLPLREPRVSAP